MRIMISLLVYIHQKYLVDAMRIDLYTISPIEIHHIIYIIKINPFILFESNIQTYVYEKLFLT